LVLATAHRSGTTTAPRLKSALRAATAQHLNKIVRGMNIDNFV